MLDVFPNSATEWADSDGDGVGDNADAFPYNAAASIDTDGDGYPDAWNEGCDIACQEDFGLVLDAFPNHVAASIDTDGDGYPDAWNEGCEIACQKNSGLMLDAFPSHAAASVDTDGDGYPDAWNEGCDIACQESSGLVLDAFPNHAAASVDTDGDGYPDAWNEGCDIACQENSGLVLDVFPNNSAEWADSDGDGVGDNADAFPYNAAASIDTDGDGYPDAWNEGCDIACQENSGLMLDAFPSHAAASVDTDGDGYPDAWNEGCDIACQESSGLVLDAFPNHAAASVDTDGDGYPDAWNEGCDIACQENSGLVLDVFPNNSAEWADSDGDGVGDNADAFPYNAAASIDTDGDGYPDAWNEGCDIACQENSGLMLDAFPSHAAASVDTDGDGYPDAWNEGCDIACQENSGLVLDAFPNHAAASVDTDGDGYPDAWNEGCDIACQQNSDLTLDKYLNDFDNDGVEDHLDPDLYADNGAPEMQSVPGEMHVSANETGTVALLKYSELLADLRALDAVDDYDVNFQAKIGASTVPFETVGDEKYLKVPVGRQVLAWHATDKSGNESSAKEQAMNVYPRIRFVEEESITGENSIAKVAVSLTGKSPVYPVVVKLEFVLGKSTLTQDDVDSSLKLSELQSLKFPAVSTVANLNIPVLDDDIAEEDETLLIKLLGVSEDTDKSEYFLLDPSYQLHKLTVTERNLPPSVVLQLYQDEKQVEEVRSDGGEVRIEANITDPNGNDTHTISWKEKGGLPFLHTDGNVLTFDPSSLKASSYDVEVTVTDSGNPPLSETKSITVEVLSSPGDEGEDENSGKTDEQKESTTGKKKKKGGSVPVVIFAGLALAYAQRRWQKSRAAA